MNDALCGNKESPTTTARTTTTTTTNKQKRQIKLEKLKPMKATTIIITGKRSNLLSIWNMQ